MRMLFASAWMQVIVLDRIGILIVFKHIGRAVVAGFPYAVNAKFKNRVQWPHVKGQSRGAQREAAQDKQVFHKLKHDTSFATDTRLTRPALQSLAKNCSRGLN